jgi:hypothetical protein
LRTILGALVIVTVADADFVLSVTEVAAIVTEPAAEGAVYVVGAPLVVDAELNVPHGEVLQVAVHVTPAFALSLATLAVRVVVADATRVVGAGDAKATEIAGGVGGVLELPPLQAVRRDARDVRQARFNI